MCSWKPDILQGPSLLLHTNSNLPWKGGGVIWLADIIFCSPTGSWDQLFTQIPRLPFFACYSTLLHGAYNVNTIPKITSHMFLDCLSELTGRSSLKTALNIRFFLLIVANRMAKGQHFKNKFPLVNFTWGGFFGVKRHVYLLKMHIFYRRCASSNR